MTAEATSPHKEFNYNDAVYLDARKAAFARSEGTCQLCGQQPPPRRTTGPSTIRRRIRRPTTT